MAVTSPVRRGGVREGRRDWPRGRDVASPIEPVGLVPSWWLGMDWSRAVVSSTSLPTVDRDSIGLKGPFISFILEESSVNVIHLSARTAHLKTYFLHSRKSMISAGADVHSTVNVLSRLRRKMYSPIITASWRSEVCENGSRLGNPGSADLSPISRGIPGLSGVCGPAGSVLLTRALLHFFM
ncbi:unnamed protein product [Nezara viridula]|uniref:Uncharacterized protein n=1 Tax=Nezara viridula TaxID=85310 RepID=A0A9P0HB20_NEZVI|nr:unnamed protein product [Nezara viridula]